MFRLAAGLLLVAGIVLGLSFISLQSAGAVGPKEQACLGSGGTWTSAGDATNPDAGSCATAGDSQTVVGVIRRVSEILIFIVGAVAVLMVIVGGLRYTFAQGDQQAVAAAKNTVLYALIGVAVATLAFAIVRFVAIQIEKPNTPPAKGKATMITKTSPWV